MRLAPLALVLAAPALAADLAKDPGLPVPRALYDVQQARNFGMGGAYGAVGYGTEAIGGNPALLSLFRRYQVELGGAWDVPNGFGFGGVSIIDSASNATAYGQSYQLVTFDSPWGRSTAHLNRSAVAYPFADWLHLGIGLQYQNISGPFATNSVTMSAGVASRLFEVWVLGFSANNLIPVASPLVNRYFTFATSVMLGGELTPTFELRMDFNAPFPRFAWAGGLEWIVGQVVPVRLGFEWDNITGTKYVGGGLGFFSEGSGVDIAYRHEIGGHEGRLIAVTIKLQQAGGR